MFCNHKWGKIENGYQYCEKCGKARLVKCNHLWEPFREIKVYNDLGGIYHKYIFKCKNCGKIKKVKSS